MDLYGSTCILSFTVVCILSFTVVFSDPELPSFATFSSVICQFTSSLFFISELLDFVFFLFCTDPLGVWYIESFCIHYLIELQVALVITGFSFSMVCMINILEEFPLMNQ